jgi:hypothetical protein
MPGVAAEEDIVLEPLREQGAPGAVVLEETVILPVSPEM